MADFNLEFKKQGMLEVVSNTIKPFGWSMVGLTSAETGHVNLMAVPLSNAKYLAGEEVEELTKTIDRLKSCENCKFGKYDTEYKQFLCKDEYSCRRNPSQPVVQFEEDKWVGLNG